MVNPEYPQYNSYTLSALMSELEDVERQLEIADENENQIERFFNRDDLLEQQDQLQAEIDAIVYFLRSLVPEDTDFSRH